MNTQAFEAGRGSGRRVRRYTTGAVSVLCIIVFALLFVARRENQALRRQLDAMREAQHHRVHEPARPLPRDRRPMAAPTAPPLTAVELQPALLQLFQECARREVSAFRYDGWPSWADIMKVFARVAPKDLPRAMAIISGLPPGNPRTELWRALLSRWAAIDPAVAAEEASSLPPGDAGTARAMVASVWAQADPAAALAYFGPNASITVFSAYARKFPTEAARIAMAYKDAAVRERAVESVANQWFARDPQAAWTWASALPPLERGFAVRPLLGRMAAADPETVAQFIAAQKGAALEPLAVHVGVVASAFAAKDPTAAATWAAQLPRQSRAYAIAGLVHMWGTEDPAAAATWIATLPEPDRSRAIRSFFSVPGNVEPDLVGALAPRTDDAALRRRIEAALHANATQIIRW